VNEITKQVSIKSQVYIIVLKCSINDLKLVMRTMTL